MARLFFRKSQRIVKDEDFSRVLSHKCFVCRGMLRLYAAPNGLDSSRFGVSVGKSVGNAVRRNQCKRLGREIFRVHQHEFASGFDYILIFTQKSKKIKPADGSSETPGVKPVYQEIEADLLKMANILQNKSSRNDSFGENGS